jgi:hypothetical protein
VDDVQAAAQWMRDALTESKYQADFSPRSLWEVDRFFDEHTQRGAAKSGGLLSQDLGARLFGLGAYVGEVIRRQKGGHWVGDDKDPQAEINVELRLADGSRCWPVQRVMKRFSLGAAEALAPYGQGLGLDVGPKPGSREPGRR